MGCDCVGHGDASDAARRVDTASFGRRLGMMACFGALWQIVGFRMKTPFDYSIFVLARRVHMFVRSGRSDHTI